MKCKFCEKEYKSIFDHINKRNLKVHTLYCRVNPNHILYKCKFCEKEEETRGKMGAHTKNESKF